MRVPLRLTLLIYSWQRVPDLDLSPDGSGSVGHIWSSAPFLCRKSRFYRKHVAKFAAVLSSGIVFRAANGPLGRERVSWLRDMASGGAEKRKIFKFSFYTNAADSFNLN